MLLSLIVQLYTSRVILNALGISDYGIYNVVGGVVTMFSFMSGTMSTYVLCYRTRQHKRIEKDFRCITNYFMVNSFDNSCGYRDNRNVAVV